MIHLHGMVLARMFTLSLSQPYVLSMLFVCLGVVDWHSCGKAQGHASIAWGYLEILLLCSFVVGKGGPLFCTCNGATLGNEAMLCAWAIALTTATAPSPSHPMV